MTLLFRLSHARYPPHHMGSLSRGAANFERSTERIEAVSHPLQTRPVTSLGWLEPLSIIAHIECDNVGIIAQQYGGRRGFGVLRDVLQASSA